MLDKRSNPAFTALAMNRLPRSPLAPAAFADLPALPAVNIATAGFGSYGAQRDNLLLLSFERPAPCAGIFTQNSIPGAPLAWSRQVVASGSARALLVNAGNANVFTGAQGEADVAALATQTAQQLGCQASKVAMASTGVIGEPLPREAFSAALTELHPQPSGAASWQAAANAIRTTDTFAKGARRWAKTRQGEIALLGIAKGSGMIAPNMATLLAFLFIDAHLDSQRLQTLLNRANKTSFAAISVDSDTSTSDMALAFASGQRLLESPEDLDALGAALAALCEDLAEQIVRDGEGATKLLRIHIKRAGNAEQARQLARAVAESPLVKTAIAGEDANWGRVLMALGKTGIPLDPTKIEIAFGAEKVTALGMRAPEYDEAAVSAYLKNPEIDLWIDLGLGEAEARFLTCDLTEGYIRINADYRS